MKVLYVPVSSQNFNNIFSSESISPAAFYAVRGYGYSRWTSIPENPFANAIVLYDELKSFVRPSSEYEDYPLVFEIGFNDSSFEALKPVAPGVYLCDTPIYLTPFSVRVHFFSENAKRVVLSMSESSLETKLLKLYNKRFILSTPTQNSYSVPEGIDGESIAFNQDALATDAKINRMKGLLYGCIIGHKLSSRPVDLHKLQVLREIQNIFAAILSSIDGRETSTQVERLSICFNYLNKQSDFYKALLGICKDETLTEDVLTLFRHYHGDIKGELHSYMFIPALTTKNGVPSSENSSMLWIEGQIKAHLNSMSQSSSFPKMEDEPVVVYSTEFKTIKSAHLPDESVKLFNHLVNGVLSSGKYNGKIGPQKNDLSDDITREAKALLGDAWDRSTEKVELNAIRKFVRGEVYDHTWADDIYSNIAALLTKGDDWDTMLRFLQTKSITDCSVAFAMYGVLNGFANLHRDFIDVLMAGDREYIGELYKEFHGQLFLEVPANLPALPEPIATQPINTEPLVDADGTIQSMDHQVQNEQKSPQEDAKDEEFEGFWSKLIKACKGVVSDRGVYLRLYKEQGLTNEFLNAVSNDSTLNNGKSIQATAKKNIEGQVKAKERQQKKESTQKASRQSSRGKKSSLSIMSGQPSLWDQAEPSVGNKEYLHFRYDNRYPLLGIIKTVYPNLNQKLYDSVFEDLSWVLDPKYVGTKTEMDLIKDFEEKLIKSKTETISKNKKDMRWKIDLYAPINVAQTISALRQACNL